MDQNKPPYYCIFYKTWRPKPSEERKRPLKSRNNSGKRVKLSDCNWDSLPNELKMMCIERADFKTRANLMLSNRHNKMLVESIKSKHHLSYVFFEAVRWFSEPQHCYEKFGFVVKSWRSTADYTSKKYERRKLMDVLLNSNIDELEFKCAVFERVIDTSLTDVLATCNKKFSVKSLCFTVANPVDLNILQRCDEQLEQISVDFNDASHSYDMRTVLGIPQFIAAKRLTVILSGGFYPVARLRTVIDWLLVDKDHDIGKEIIFQYKHLSWQNVLTWTETRRDFHHPTEKIMCIRTKNPSKRVWAWESKDHKSLNFLVSAVGFDAPNVKEIQKQRTKERKEYLLKTRL